LAVNTSTTLAFEFHLLIKTEAR